MSILDQNEDELDKTIIKRYIEERKREILLRRPDLARKIFLKRLSNDLSGDLSREINKKIIERIFDIGYGYERNNKS